jgi:hypothetical protein
VGFAAAVAQPSLGRTVSRAAVRLAAAATENHAGCQRDRRGFDGAPRNYWIVVTVAPHATVSWHSDTGPV